MPFVANRAFGWEPVEITEEWGLRDIKRGMAYPLCNSVQCSSCGALFLDIRFTAAEMSALYSGYREDEYADLRERFEPGYKARNSILLGGSTYVPRIESFLSNHMACPSIVLDWGGDTGLNTPFGSRCGQLHIYDISGRTPVGNASSVSRESIANVSYDLIVLSNVLEHVPFPVVTLSEVASAVKANSTLYVEVPHEELVRSNPQSRQLHRQKKHWHEHINFFTRDSIKCLFERCGLRIAGVESMEVSVGGRNGYVLAIAATARDRS